MGRNIRQKIRNRWFRHIVQAFYWRVARFGRRVHGRGPLLVAMGDSHTDPFVGLTLPWRLWLRHVGRRGYKTVNLGHGGETTADMYRRVDDFLAEGHPEIAVLFAGSCDVEHGVDPAETERSVTSILRWLDEHGVNKVVLIGPGLLNLERPPWWLAHIPDWAESVDRVRTILRDVAARHDVLFVDLAQFLRDRIARGEDPDFSRVPYRQSRSWHVCPGDAHFNAYGQRLIAEAFLAATDHWRSPSTVRQPSHHRLRQPHAQARLRLRRPV